jgi:hypothetical protein
LRILALHRTSIQHLTFINERSVLSGDNQGIIVRVNFKLSFFLREWAEDVIVILGGTAGPIKDMSALPESRGNDHLIDKYNLVAFSTSKGIF